MPRLQLIVTSLSLFILSLGLPILFATFSDLWYGFNCALHGRCASLGEPAEVMRLVDQLQALMWHNAPLGAIWSAKETQHLIEVRDLFITAFQCLGLALMGLLWSCLRWRHHLPNAARYCAWSFVLLACILPFFGYFWRHIFHSVLFDNQLWLTNRYDVLWYLTPRVFFFHTFILILITGIAGNACLALMGSKKEKNPAKAR